MTASVMALGLGIAGCGSDQAAEASDRQLRVVVTNSVLEDWVRIVGAGHLEIYDVIRAGVDPHDHELTPADLYRIGRADVVVSNGLGLDPWVDDAMERSGSEASLVVATDGVAVRTVDGERDPHVWHDPRNAAVMVDNIARALAAVDTDTAHGADYNRATWSYGAELAQLDRDIAARIATLSNKTLVTNHDAFWYYVARYGLTFAGSILPGFDAAADLSLSRTNELVRSIRSTKVRAVFAEASVPAKVAAVVAREAGATIVDGADALYADGLGPRGSPGSSYLMMMRHNTETIVKNLR
jgi:ABC-type Zn uptake system ZnuABC Zn-binding protein ZnuA